MHLYRTFCDKELIDLLKVGDESAFTELYRRHWQSMFNGAYKRLQDTEQSQDIVQNIFTDLWERRGEVEIDNLPAYLHTAVRFQVIKQTTRQPQNSGFLNAFETTLTSSGQTDDALLENEVLDLLKLWIAALPEKRRAIFLLYYFEDRSTSDIALHLEISQKTVQNQLNTATTTLRSRLEKILFFDLLAFSIFFD